MIDKDSRYTQTHEWAKAEEDNIVTIGISAYAVQQLGDIVYLELPTVGQTVTKEQAFGVIESVKAASDLYSPVSGKVIAVNEELPDNFDVLNEETYGKGWMFKIETDTAEQFNTLMDGDDYEKYLKGL